MKSIRKSKKAFFFIFTAVVLITAANAITQEKFPDKIFPRSESWSVKCLIYRMTDTSIILLFPGHEQPSEVSKVSISRIEFGDGRELYFNESGQVEREISIPEPVLIAKVLNPGLVRLQGGEEVVLNGINFELPADSVANHYFQKGTEYLRSLLEGEQVTLQFDLQRRDEFGRYRAYILLSDGMMVNAEIIRNGFCPLDRGRPLMYLDDFRKLEVQARNAGRGLWKKD